LTTVAIIFITGDGDIPTTVQAMKAGAVEFLTKPFDVDALLSAIRQALEHGRIAPDREAEVRRLQVNVPDTLKRLRSSKRIPRGFRRHTAGHLPSGLMMQRPTRSSLPNLIQAVPNAVRVPRTGIAQDYIFRAYSKR
jgi:DNA-binding response OmpR family regulator